MPAAAATTRSPPAAAQASISLDDVAAAAARLTARQRRGDALAGSLDAIPHLSRPLAQLRRDTQGAASAHPAPSPDAVHASAIRLLAAAPDFAPDRLRRAVDDLGELARNPARAAALADPRALSWLDDPAAAPQEDLSAGALQERHRDAIVQRAADFLRLDASLAARVSFKDGMERDLAAAKIPLLAALHGAVDPSAAIPGPFVAPGAGTPMGGGGSPATFSAVRPYVAGERTPGTSAGKPPRVGMRSMASSAKMGTPASLGGTPASLGGTPARRRPGSPMAGGSPLPTPSKAGTPNPRNVTTTDPDVDYLSEMREHVLGASIPSEIAGQLLDHGEKRADHFHFLCSLAILADLSAISARRSMAEGSGTGVAETKVNVSFHDLICTARHRLEQFFAECVGGIPLDTSQRTAADVRAGVRAHVARLMNTNSIRFTPDMRSNPSGPIYFDELPFWPQFYYCLRCGSPSAALSLADDAHEYLDEDAVHFRFYLHEFLRGGVAMREALDGDDPGDALQDDDVPPPLQITDEYMTRHVPGTLRDFSNHTSLAEEYEHHVYQCNDPYRRASYVLLSRLEVSPGAGAVGGGSSKPGASGSTVTNRVSLRHRHTHKVTPGAQASQDAARCSLRLRDEDYDILFDSMEDFYWLKLWLCRTEKEEDMLRRFGGGLVTLTLPSIQDEIQGFGHSYFDSDGKTPLLYAFMLVACGLPWQAVEYLASLRSPIMSAYAAYLSLPMYAMEWAPSDEAYASVVWAHMIHFACDHPDAAALCLFSIRDRDILYKSLQQLVVDTMKFRDLLGDGENDRGVLVRLASDVWEARTGRRVDDSGNDAMGESSLISGSVSLVDFILQLRLETASGLADSLRQSARLPSFASDTWKAAALYAVCGEKAKQVDATLHALSRVVAAHEVSALREDIICGARLLGDREDYVVPDHLGRSFKVLLKVSSFFDQYWTKNYVNAWSELVAMDILPMDVDSIHEYQRRFEASSNYYAQVVLDRLPDLLRAALELAEKRWGGGDATLDMSYGGAMGAGPSVMEVQALVTFAGLAGFAEGDLSARLVRLELLLS